LCGSMVCLAQLSAIETLFSLVPSGQSFSVSLVLSFG
jgi:hypothetical protein